MLRVALDGEVMGRQGAMVAYQGQVDFAYQGAGGMGKFLKKTFTGEGMPLMKVSGRGDVFFADDAMEIHLVNLENDALTVNGSNVLAFDSTLAWDIKRVEGASMMAGGVFNTTFTGTGTVAITSHGTPVVLNVDAPTSPTSRQRSPGRRRSPRPYDAPPAPGRSSVVAQARPSSSGSVGTRTNHRRGQRGTGGGPSGSH